MYLLIDVIVRFLIEEKLDVLLLELRAALHSTQAVTVAAVSARYVDTFCNFLDDLRHLPSITYLNRVSKLLFLLLWKLRAYLAFEWYTRYKLAKCRISGIPRCWQPPKRNQQILFSLHKLLLIIYLLTLLNSGY